MKTLAALLLLAAHALLVVFASSVPEPIAPFLAASVYGPLWPLQALGAPVFAPTGGWGWSSPSVLGWAVLALFWGGFWLGAVWLVARITRRG